MHLDKMKITREQLKQIIKEEILDALDEQERPAGGGLGGPGGSPRHPTPEERERAGVDPAAALAGMLDFMAERMLSAYDDEVPPPLQKMVDLIRDNDYESIQTDYNRMWADLIQHHRDTGTSLEPRVSHNFRAIGSILRNS